MLFHPRVAPFDKRANRGGRRVEDADLVLLDYLPEAIVLGEIRRAFIHHDRRAGRQRPVNGVAVAGDPSDIGGAPVDIVVLQVEHPPHRHQHVRQVSAGSMHDALGLAGGAAGVEGEQRMLAVELRGVALRALRGDQLVPPDVAPLAHLDLVADALEHEHFADRIALLQRVIDILLELDDLPAPPSAVRGDTDLRFGVVDSIGQRLRREAAEHDRMNRADPRAREHRHRRLRHQRHVDRDAVALLDAETLERVTASPHFVGEHLVGQHARIAGLALPNQRGLVAARTVEMAIEAIVRGIDRAADEPLRMRKVPFERFAERLEPMQVARAFGPESFGVGVGAMVQRLVFAGAFDPRLGAEFSGGREFAGFGQRRIDMSRFGRGHRTNTFRSGFWEA